MYCRMLCTVPSRRKIVQTEHTSDPAREVWMILHGSADAVDTLIEHHVFDTKGRPMRNG